MTQFMSVTECDRLSTFASARTMDCYAYVQLQSTAGHRDSTPAGPGRDSSRISRDTGFRAIRWPARPPPEAYDWEGGCVLGSRVGEEEGVKMDCGATARPARGTGRSRWPLRSRLRWPATPGPPGRVVCVLGWNGCSPACGIGASPSCREWIFATGSMARPGGPRHGVIGATARPACGIGTPPGCRDQDRSTLTLPDP